ncbi:MAG: flagellar hook-length control protein FliK, partial [Rubrivivax sp.]|nr:flagellar hook-length control protein FliK [Rubrivivax sp.]
SAAAEAPPPADEAASAALGGQRQLRAAWRLRGDDDGAGQGSARAESPAAAESRRLESEQLVAGLGLLATATSAAGPARDGAFTQALHAVGGVSGGAGASTASATSAAIGSATPREATLASAPGSEAFARELGTQVSLFVREGVQQARLHLNPQELGPVLVRIQLEGQAAQVHLAADAAPTRQALEDALPTLARQLSEAGLTLTGGGVSERPAQDFGAGGREAAQGEPGRGPAAFTPASVETASALAPGAAWSRPRGLVDLVA